MKRFLSIFEGRKPVENVIVKKDQHCFSYIYILRGIKNEFLSVSIILIPWNENKNEPLSFFMCFQVLIIPFL